jgi:hypothetical protein
MATGIKATGRDDSTRGSVPKGQGGTGNSSELGGGAGSGRKKQDNTVMPPTSLGQ